MQSSWWFSLPSALLLFGACLDIERTPAANTGGAGGAETGTGAQEAGGVPADFTPTPCVQACVDKTPAGTRSFALLAICTETARVEACAEACSGATGLDPGSSTCAVPGSVDAVPACSNCIKQTCCQALSDCFASDPCLSVAFCALGCSG